MILTFQIDRNTFTALAPIFALATVDKKATAINLKPLNTENKKLLLRTG